MKFVGDDFCVFVERLYNDLGHLYGLNLFEGYMLEQKLFKWKKVSKKK